MMLGTRKLEKAMEQAASYEEWKEAALAYDEAKGFDRWRAKDSSSQFDNVSIRIRLDRLRSDLLETPPRSSMLLDCVGRRSAMRLGNTRWSRKWGED